VMTRYMSLSKLKWLDGDTIRSHPFKQVGHFFVRFAHLEFYHKQSQELWCLGAIVADCLLDGFLEGDKQVMGGEEARAQASLNLEGILPVHRLDPALDLKEFAMREESHRTGIHVGNAGGTGFALCDVAHILELAEIVSLSKNNTQMMCEWSDAGMGGVNRRYPVARLEFPFALDTLWSPTVVNFLLKGWRRM
jgi:hypothetical protein